MIRRLQRYVAAFVSAIAVTLVAPAALRAMEVVVTRIDGTTLDGQLKAIAEDGVRLVEDDAFIAWDEAAGVTFMTPAPPSEAAPPAATFHFVAGGQLSGEIVAAAKESIVARTRSADEVTLPFASLAAVTFTRGSKQKDAANVIAAARAERRPGQDTLVADDNGEPKAVRGTLTSLGPTTSDFLFAGKARSIETARIFGVVFAAAAAASPAPATLKLHDGDAIPGKIAPGEQPEGRIRFDAAFGKTVELPLAALDMLEFHNPRIVFLSDLEPASVKTAGLVHEPWPWRRDRNAGNSTISLAGRKYVRGLGVHARTELVYALDGGYETFAAVLGIDDAVRPRGAVAFTVLADSREVFASGPLGGMDRPKTVSVPVAGAKTLTLIADYGPGADIADWADWAAARLIRSK